MNIQPLSPQHAMPPESFTSLPLTLPPTGEKAASSVWHIIQEIRNRQEGRGLAGISWTRYTLDIKGCQGLLQQLRTDESLWSFSQHKLRYDYFPSVNRLVLRMPTLPHEQFIAQIVERIQLQLKSIEGESAQFAKKISSGGSASITSPTKNTASTILMRNSATRRPGIRESSDSDIRVVVGLDVEYRTNKKATLSVWRPNIITNEVGKKELVAQQIVTNQVFRHGNGDPDISRTGGLQLRLRDFATEALTQSEGRLRDPIIISANTLCLFLKLAENRTSVVGQQAGVVTSAKPWVRKRRREATPPEELKYEDEKRFRASENKAIDQATKDDSSYKAGSTSEAESS